MKSSLFLAGASALLATAAPLEKRVMKTDWVYEEVTVTVTADSVPTTLGALFVEKPVVTQTKIEQAAPSVIVKTTIIQVPQPEPTVRVIKEPATSKAIEIPKPKITTKVVEAPKPEPTTVVEEPEPEPTTKAEEPKPEPTTAEPEPTTVEPEPTTAEAATETAGVTGDYKDIILEHHNVHRANHSAQALEYDDDLASSAEILAKTCVFDHDQTINGGGYGQNLASWGSTDNIDGLKERAAAQGITNQWYNDEMPKWSFYGLSDPSGDFDAIGHFSQMVWLKSERVGCATVKCPQGTVLDNVPAWYTVCNYAPTGNVVGAFAENVLEPEGDKRVVV